MRIDIIVLVSLLIYFFMIYCKQYYSEEFTNFKSSCGKYTKLLYHVMKKRGMKHSDTDFNIYIPCSYNNCEKEVRSFEGAPSNKKLFLIDGCDWLASKLSLWQAIKEYHGTNATKYVPPTFLLEDKEDINRFIQHYERNKKVRSDQIYVLKNYEQRQEGIKLTRDKDEIINGLGDGWYLVQDYLYDPLLIDKRKVNLRYYLLVTCYQGITSAYIHKDGFVYYTPEYYDDKDMSFNKHITTGYIDRKVYEKNPLTLEDFRNYLGKSNENIWNNNVNNLMFQIMKALNKKICNNPKLNNHFRFQLFGCDLAPSSNLDAKLIEINKGPDLDAKDERDEQVKIKVQEDIFNIVDPQYINQQNETRFIKIF